MNEQRMIDQVDTMVASGRITHDETERVRAGEHSQQLRSHIKGLP